MLIDNERSHARRPNECLTHAAKRLAEMTGPKCRAEERPTVCIQNKLKLRNSELLKKNPQSYEEDVLADSALLDLVKSSPSPNPFSNSSAISSYHFP
jgi:hypothetical protein